MKEIQNEKETSSLNPVSPQKKKNVLIGGLLSFIAFTFLAFFIEYIQQKKSQRRE
jgi:capsular polysaccharide biosynthesis protein